MNRAWSVSLALCIAGMLAGCAADPTQGYSTKSVFPESVSTIAVPIFDNQTYNRQVPFELTDALIKEIEANTPYKVTAESRADTILVGTIRSVRLDSLSKSQLTGLSEEVIVSVTIDFEWKDLRSGKTLVQRQSFAGHGLFVPSQPSSEPIDLGEFAVVHQLAQDIVSEMRADW